LTNGKERRPAAAYRRETYEAAVINSALWAAAGDALGWMTELSRDRGNVRHRTGSEQVNQTVDWRRLIGGRGGVTVDLPAGTYSDDTQLRLCVSRSIRGNGSFDVETFAKIELTVWQAYSLGAGIGSKAAALNLSKRGVNWFSNFFADERQRYTSAGGNGAAMRIQPHVWSARLSLDDMLLNVFRDSIATHGHPHGFGGALFHALCLWDTIISRELPSIDQAKNYLSLIRRLPETIRDDGELMQFWVPTWERESGQNFPGSLDRFANEALADLDIALEVLSRPTKTAYIDALDRLGCLSERFRGSGFKTALAALILSHLFGADRIESALAASANEIRSDTDTIATMAGALLGILSKNPPTWPIQDRDYIENDARRLARVGLGEDQTGFSYPDLSTWEAPSSQSDAVVKYGGDFGMVGLGKLKPMGQEYQSAGFIWQWFELPFQQTVLAKRRSDVSKVASEDQMPGKQREQNMQPTYETAQKKQERFAFDPEPPREGRIERHRSEEDRAWGNRFPGLDRASDIAISSGFNDATIGKLVNQCIDESGSIEIAVSLTAIIAKAKLARMRRRS
jgi:ADP-ribosylglycohydrolase